MDAFGKIRIDTEKYSHVLTLYKWKIAFYYQTEEELLVAQEKLMQAGLEMKLKDQKTILKTAIEEEKKRTPFEQYLGMDFSDN